MNEEEVKGIYSPKNSLFLYFLSSQRNLKSFIKCINIRQQSRG